MTKTFKQLNEIDNTVGAMYLENPDLKNSKFGYGYKRFYQKNLETAFQEYKEELLNTRIDHALVDEKTKAILTDKDSTRGFMYDKIGIRNVIKAEKDLAEKYMEKEYEIEPYFIAPENLPELSESELEVLKGVLVE